MHDLAIPPVPGTPLERLASAQRGLQGVLDILREIEAADAQLERSRRARAELQAEKQAIRAGLEDELLGVGPRSSEVRQRYSELHTTLLPEAEQQIARDAAAARAYDPERPGVMGDYRQKTENVASAVRIVLTDDVMVQIGHMALDAEEAMVKLENLAVAITEDAERCAQGKGLSGFGGPTFENYRAARGIGIMGSMGCGMNAKVLAGRRDREGRFARAATWAREAARNFTAKLFADANTRIDL
jgi:hypothetical protein